MKDLKTLAVTLGIGSALAFFMTKDSTRKSLIRTGKKLKTVLRADRAFGEDDNDMRYI
ncbi:hypothetical protein [Fulvivirga sedimenti]|uniref:Uncharacterized protein n=1 Tax=Fulvivirga sedimenti TaxID=2879465 RepID=A0A9X1HP30_9BACT|nr:hypothetical protein [Fulvivirga sedimenti]MCA6074172.1 hypothetical protein [Fulvivirga sedimenti]